MSPTRGSFPDVHPAATERVDAAPAPGDVEQLEVTYARRQGRIDDEVLTVRLETEHRAQQQERRSGRPRLRAARRGVLDGVHRLLARITSERLRKTPLEELGCIEDAKGDLGGLALEAVLAQAPG